MEQHYCLCCPVPTGRAGRGVLSSPHPMRSSICVGQSFVTLPRFGCPETPAIPFPLTAQPKRSVAGEEKSGILYVHIYLPAVRPLRLAGFPPAPQPSSALIPGQGHLEGRQRWLAEGGCKMRRPHQT